MIIAIERGLENLKHQLESRGYECFYIGENRIADAILYEDHVNQPYFGVNIASMTNMSGFYDSHSHGAILINTKGKSIDEITNILTNRTYSPLF